MKNRKTACPTWVILEENFIIVITQALKPLKSSSPKSLEEILDYTMPKLSEQLRIVKQDVIKEYILRTAIDMKLLTSEDEIRAMSLIRSLRDEL